MRCSGQDTRYAGALLAEGTELTLTLPTRIKPHHHHCRPLLGRPRYARCSVRCTGSSGRRRSGKDSSNPSTRLERRLPLFTFAAKARSPPGICRGHSRCIPGMQLGCTRRSLASPIPHARSPGRWGRPEAWWRYLESLACSFAANIAARSRWSAHTLFCMLPGIAHQARLFFRQ